MEEKLTSAERKELEALRAAKVAQEREEAGLDTGKLVCVTPGCNYGERDAEMVKDVFQRVNEDTGTIENEVVRWRPIEDPVCPECTYPLAVIEPNAQSVFPRNYRWVYPKPVGQ